MLLVDDSRDYADAMSELIQACTTWDADVAYGAAEAIAKAEIRRPDAVFLDLEMPLMTGFQAAEALERLYPANPPIILAVSGNISLVHAAQQDPRFSRSWLKPLDLDLLVEWLEETRWQVDKQPWTKGPS